MVVFKQHGCQIIIAAGAEQVGFDDGARGDHSHHFAREQSFLGLVANLFTNGDPVALLDQPAQVIFYCVKWNSGHRHAYTLGHRP